jgi:predicted Zn-dependent protease
MRPIRRILAAGLAGLMLAGCGAPGGAPGPAQAQDARFEQTQSRRVLDELRAKDKLWEEDSLNRYVQGIADRIDRARPASAPDLRVFIIKDGEANAFTTGAGYIFVNGGMLALFENEAQLAMVLAHEAAHVDQGHVVEGMEQRQRVGLIGALAGVAGQVAGVPDQLLRLGIGLGSQYAVSDFSRDQERAADELGLRYAARSGYDAVEGATSFEVLRRLYGEQGGLGQFFSSHPRSSERQADLRRRAREIGAGGGRVAADLYLRRTERIRREALEYYQRNGRGVLAEQARRNLRRGN